MLQRKLHKTGALLFLISMLLLVVVHLVVEPQSFAMPSPSYRVSVTNAIGAFHVADSLLGRSGGADKAGASDNSDTDEMTDYPPGMEYPEEPRTQDTKNPFNPFDMSKSKEGPDENADGDSGWSIWPWNWGKNVATNMSKWVWSTINNFLLKMVRGAYKSVMEFLSKYIFQDLSLNSDSRILSIYTGFAWMVGCVFLVLIIVVGIKSILGVSFGYADYRLKAALPRIVLAGFCAIFALPLCQFFINMTHSASVSTLSLFDPESAQIPFNVLWDHLVGIAPSSMSPFIFILILFLLIGFIGLGCFYVIRRAALMVLIILAPLALALWVDDSTSDYTTLWARAFFALVFVEFLHALIILLFFQTLFAGAGTDVLANVLFCFALLYLMYKIPSYIFQSTVVNWGRPQALKSIGTAGGVAHVAKMAGTAGG